MKILIIVDTNILRGNEDRMSYKEIISDELKNIMDNYSKYDNIFFSIPEIVFKELEYQKIKAYNSSIHKIETEFEKINAVGGNNKFILDKELRYEDYFEKKKSNLLQNKKIIEICLTYNKQSFISIINNCIKKNPPFNKGKSDKGFKDNLIIESIKNFENFNKYRIIFYTKNKNDFEKVNEKKIKIVFDNESLKEEIESIFRVANIDIHNYLGIDYFKEKLEEELDISISTINKFNHYNFYENEEEIELLKENDLEDEKISKYFLELKETNGEKLFKEIYIDENSKEIFLLEDIDEIDFYIEVLSLHINIKTTDYCINNLNRINKELSLEQKERLIDLILDNPEERGEPWYKNQVRPRVLDQRYASRDAINFCKRLIGDISDKTDKIKKLEGELNAISNTENENL